MSDSWEEARGGAAGAEASAGGAARVLGEMARIGFHNPADLFGADGAPVRPGALPPEVAAGVRAFVRWKAGETQAEVRLASGEKARALHDMGRALGLFGSGTRSRAGDWGRPHPAPCGSHPPHEGEGDPFAPWEPLDGPQKIAFESAADVTGYGGAAGGGKTDLGIGLAIRSHRRSAIFRREGTQLSGIVERIGDILGGTAGYSGAKKRWRLPGGGRIEFGSAPHLGDERRYQGRPKDLLVIDEATGFAESQARFLMGWVRSATPGQRCRTVMTFNPPTGAEGRWVVDYFAPWLDPGHPKPAQSGELRWFASVDGKDVELEGPGPYAIVEGRTVQDFDPAAAVAMTPQSRTFIASRVSDNPHLAQSGYLATLQAMPEPLRSQMLEGDFAAGCEDDQWQVIPTAWVEAAMGRWRTGGPSVAFGDTSPRSGEERGPMDSLGVDVARGGRDETIIARRHGTWFDELVCLPGKATPDGPSLAAEVVARRRDRAVAVIDVVGWGASPYDILCANGVQAVAVNGAARSLERTAQAGLAFANLRAQLWWRMREALDPEAPAPLALPPDPRLKGDLTAPRWKLTAAGVQIEAKAEVEARIGRSPDRGDAAVMALMPVLKRAEHRAPSPPRGTWMGG